MLLIALLVLIFWVVLPGLLTGWMLRELRRHFLLGLSIGVIFGPLGPFIALALLPFVRPRPARGRAHEAARAFDPFYSVPFVGRLHVTTAWSLAGVVAFFCAWMIGGLGYEFYTARFGAGEAEGARAARLRANQQGTAASGGVAPSRLQENSKQSPAAQSNNAPPAAGQMVSGLAGQASHAAQPTGHAAGTPPAANQTPSDALPSGPGSVGAEGAGVAAPSVNAPPTPDAPPPPPSRPPAQAREAAVSEVARGLASAGHRVHVAVSGDAQTATLSISGPTLTRQAGNQFLGRARQTLKAAGIRIIVMNNGPESWTYIL